MPKSITSQLTTKRHWLYRDDAARQAAKVNAFRRQNGGAVKSSWEVLRRPDLSLGAKLLFCALRSRDDHVICVDPQQIAGVVGVSSDAIRGCLTELTHAGVITGWLGNLLFFD